MSMDGQLRLNDADLGLRIIEKGAVLEIGFQTERYDQSAEIGLASEGINGVRRSPDSIEARIYIGVENRQPGATTPVFVHCYHLAKPFCAQVLQDFFANSLQVVERFTKKF
jgi:hypothetical protein